jgi:hypothetical protein
LPAAPAAAAAVARPAVAAAAAARAAAKAAPAPAPADDVPTSGEKVYVLDSTNGARLVAQALDKRGWKRLHRGDDGALPKGLFEARI